MCGRYRLSRRKQLVKSISTAALENKVKGCALLLVGLFSYPTVAQISSGTIIVFHLTKDKFIIAADSRAVFKGKPEDSDCKIAVFHHQFVFATSGASGYRPDEGFDPVHAFDNVQEARDAIRQRSVLSVKKTLVDDIADAWADSLIKDWQLMYSWHPDLVIEAATRGKGTLATGMFAGAVKGETVLVGRAITFSKDRRELIVSAPIPYDCEARLCATGMTEVFDEYTSFPPQTQRAEREAILKPTKNETARIIRLVHLSILYTTHKDEIGGNVDALELWNNGSVHWVARKENCPENQD
jgi:hypothetical protein